MVGQFRLQRSLQDCFRELFQKAVLADDVFRLLVIGQQLINECLVDGHRFPFSSSDGRLHSPFYTLHLSEGRGEVFSLDILFHRMSVLSMAIGSHSPLPMVVYTVPFTPSISLLEPSVPIRQP